MVEGPTAKLYSIMINKALLNGVIEDIYVKSRRVYIDPKKLLGHRLMLSDTYGKNILLRIDGYGIRIHLMLYGSIHIYEADEELKKPFNRVRLLIKFSDRRLVVYNAPIVEINYFRNILDSLKSNLGLDPLRREWNKDEVLKYLLKNGDKKIGVALLDQRIVAGIGNILRNEILFRAKIHSERFIKDLSTEELNWLIRISRELSREFLRIKLKKRRLRDLLYVYNRAGKNCKICGSKIKFYMQDEINRKTFVCEYCQRNRPSLDTFII